MLASRGGVDEVLDLLRVEADLALDAYRSLNGAIEQAGRGAYDFEVRIPPPGPGVEVMARGPDLGAAVAEATGYYRLTGQAEPAVYVVRVVFENGVKVALPHRRWAADHVS